MGVEEPKIAAAAAAETTEVPSESVTTAAPPPHAPATADTVDVSKDVSEEKAVIPLHPTPPPSSHHHEETEKVDDSKALAVVEKVPDSTAEKGSGGSIDRDRVLARVETEKRMSLIKAWEESEKSKAENKAQRKLSTIEAWENTKKANVEAQLRQIEEKLEKKKGEYTEKMKNKIALLHKAAEEKRAMVEAKRGEDLLKAEEFAAKYRATGNAPKKILGCFGG